MVAGLKNLIEMDPLFCGPTPNFNKWPCYHSAQSCLKSHEFLLYADIV